MLGKFAVASIAAGLLASGCGSHSSSATSSAAPRSAPAPLRAGETSPIHHPQRPAPAHTFRITLSGANQVPGQAPTASAVALVSLRPGTSQVCWTFLGMHDVSKPTAAYIHDGARGVNGPVIVPFGAAYSQRGCIRVATSILNAIASAPRVYYVSLVTARSAKGAARAQL